MTTNKKPIYKRIILKLSGEALQGSEAFGIDANILNKIAQEIKKLVELNIQVGVVIGGGNLLRGSVLAKNGMNRVIGDHMGMLATVMNGLAIYDTLYRIKVHTRLMSSIPFKGVCEHYSWIKAIKLLCNNCVVILCSGTGNPFFTTDSAACLRGIEIRADAMLKATRVNGIFTTDPIKDSSATMYDRISYSMALEKELKIMDLAAFILARDHKLPIRVFNINKPNALYRIVMGEKEGTLITE